MRSEWLQHVRETREKGKRGRKTMSYKESMKAASESWPARKKKLERLKAKLAKAKTSERAATKRAGGATDSPRPAQPAPQ